MKVHLTSWSSVRLGKEQDTHTLYWMTGGCDVIDNNSIDKLSINVGIGILSLKRTERKQNKIGGNTCLVVVEIDSRPQ